MPSLRIRVSLSGPTRGVFDWRKLRKEALRTHGRSAAVITLGSAKNRGRNQADAAAAIGLQDSGARPELSPDVQARLEARLTGANTQPSRAKGDSGGDASSDGGSVQGGGTGTGTGTGTGSGKAKGKVKGKAKEKEKGKGKGKKKRSRPTAKSPSAKKSAQQAGKGAKKGKGKGKGKASGKGKGKKDSSEKGKKARSRNRKVGEGTRSLQDVIQHLESRTVRQPLAPEQAGVWWCAAAACFVCGYCVDSHRLVCADYYDTSDPFIDDSELVAIRDTGNNKRRSSGGFFVSSGGIDMDAYVLQALCSLWRCGHTNSLSAPFAGLWCECLQK